MNTKTLPRPQRAFAIAILVGLIAIASVFMGSRPSAPSAAPAAASAQAAQSVSVGSGAAVVDAQPPMAVVNVVGKRMSPEQKAAFDRAGQSDRLASRI